VSELSLRDDGVGGHSDDQSVVEYGCVPRGGGGADGGLGQEEGGEVSEGVWWEVSEEAVCDGAGCVVKDGSSDAFGVLPTVLLSNKKRIASQVARLTEGVSAVEPSHTVSVGITVMNALCNPQRHR